MLLLLLLLLLLCARLGIAQFDASAAWPADGGGGSRGQSWLRAGPRGTLASGLGYASSPLPTASGVTSWVLTAGQGGVQFATASDQPLLRALNYSVSAPVGGALLWGAATAGPCLGAAAVAAAGYVVCVSQRSIALYASLTGAEAASFNVTALGLPAPYAALAGNAQTSPVLAGGLVCYVYGSGGNMGVACVSAASGALVWAHNDSSSGVGASYLRITPSVLAGVLVATYASSAYTLNATTGAQLGMVSLVSGGTPFFATRAAVDAAAGALYVQNYDSQINAYNITASASPILLWNRAAFAGSIAAAGVAAAPSTPPALFASYSSAGAVSVAKISSADGSIVATASAPAAGGELASQPVASGDGATVYFAGLSSGRVFLVDAQSGAMVNASLPSAPVSLPGPIIGAGGVLLCATPGASYIVGDFLIPSASLSPSPSASTTPSPSPSATASQTPPSPSASPSVSPSPVSPSLSPSTTPSPVSPSPSPSTTASPTPSLGPMSCTPYGCYQTTSFAAPWLTQLSACQALYGGSAAGWSLAFAINAGQAADIAASCAGVLAPSVAAFWIGLYDSAAPMGSAVANTRPIFSTYANYPGWAWAGNESTALIDGPAGQALFAASYPFNGAIGGNANCVKEIPGAGIADALCATALPACCMAPSTTATPSPSASASASPSPSASVSATMTPSPSTSATGTASTSASASASLSASASATLSASASQSAAATPSVSPSVASLSATPSASPSASLSASVSASPSASASVAVTASPSLSASVAASATLSASATASVPSSTPSSSASALPSPSVSASPSVSSTVSSTASQSAAASASPSPLASPSPSPSTSTAGAIPVLVLSAIASACSQATAGDGTVMGNVSASVAAALGVPGAWVATAAPQSSRRRELALAVATSRALAGTWTYASAVTVLSSASADQLASVNAGLAVLTATAGPGQSYAAAIAALAALGANASATGATAFIRGVACGGAGAACSVTAASGGGGVALSVGAIAGIAVGGAVALVLLVAVVVSCGCARRCGCQCGGGGGRSRLPNAKMPGGDSPVAPAAPAPFVSFSSASPRAPASAFRDEEDPDAALPGGAASPT